MSFIFYHEYSFFLITYYQFILRPSHCNFILRPSHCNFILRPSLDNFSFHPSLIYLYHYIKFFRYYLIHCLVIYSFMNL